MKVIRSIHGRFSITVDGVLHSVSLLPVMDAAGFYEGPVVEAVAEALVAVSGEAGEYTIVGEVHEAASGAADGASPTMSESLNWDELLSLYVAYQQAHGQLQTGDQSQTEAPQGEEQRETPVEQPKDEEQPKVVEQPQAEEQPKVVEQPQAEEQPKTEEAPLPGAPRRKRG